MWKPVGIVWRGKWGSRDCLEAFGYVKTGGRERKRGWDVSPHIAYYYPAVGFARSTATTSPKITARDIAA